MPYGRDPRTCPPCALIRWRRLLLAYDTGGRPAAIAQMNRRGLATEHCCRSADDSSATATDGNESGDGPAEAERKAAGERWLFPTVHKTGQPGRVMTGDAVAAMIQRRAAAAGFTAAQVDLLGGHSLRSGFVTEAFRAGADAHSIMGQTGHRDPKSAFYIKAVSSKTFNGLDSLCGAKVAVENGTTQQGQAQDQSKQCTAAGKPAVTVLSFDGQNDANLAVSSGRADLGFADGGLASYIVKQSHGEFAITGSPIEDVAQTGIAMPKGSGMAKATQAAINAMIKDGTYMQILKKWGTVGEAIPQSQINVAKS